MRRISVVILKSYYYGFAPSKSAQWTTANYHNLRGVMGEGLQVGRRYDVYNVYVLLLLL